MFKLIIYILFINYYRSTKIIYSIHKLKYAQIDTICLLSVDKQSFTNFININIKTMFIGLNNYNYQTNL